ncbi:hypothetical protein L7F22_034435 [Adiantum nelumboides]|nr:hypothetical protein [Adiantum nelumboides]
MWTKKTFSSFLKHKDVILGTPWFDRLAASIKFLEMKISFKFKEKDMYINAQESGSSIPLVNDQAFDKSIKSSVFAYMIFVKDSLNGVDETQVNENGMQVDLELSNSLNQFQDVFIDDIPGELPPKRGDDDHMIELIPGSSPPNKPSYRVSQAQQEEVMRQGNELVEKGMDSWLETAKLVSFRFRTGYKLVGLFRFKFVSGSGLASSGLSLVQIQDWFTDSAGSGLWLSVDKTGYWSAFWFWLLNSAGATVRLACRDMRFKTFVYETTITDEHGYFLFLVKDFQFRRHKGVRGCRVVLISSPDPSCARVTNINYGRVGSPLIAREKVYGREILYSLGPFAFAPSPSSCYKH